MKNKQTILKTVLLFAFTILLFSCNKDVVEPTPQAWNYSTFTDARDGKIYKTIKIGNQEWMAENLAFKTDRGSWNYGGSEKIGAKYGRLYTWEAAKLAIPNGWHLTTDEEWKQLEMELGMTKTAADSSQFRGTNEGTKLKATNDWAENGNGTNDIGFTALPGGFRSNSGGYFVIEWHSYWWTATESDNLSAWYRFIASSESKIYRQAGYKGDAYYVRCIKD